MAAKTAKAAPKAMTRSEVLQLANTLITKDRHATHGEAENSFGQIAGIWNWYLAERFLEAVARPLTPYDVSMMMELFKKARAKGNPRHLDNHVDGIGYNAITAEFSQRLEDDDA